eukprot:c25146_g1_i1 orf=384-2912(+)
MFYSHFILAKKGPLGTIWIAAHLERKLRKNQIAETDISASVDSIMFPEVPIALRLSGHLLLGLVRIYSRKVNYLFHDCSEALNNIKLAFHRSAVDLPPEAATAAFHSVTLPETFDFYDSDRQLSGTTARDNVEHHVTTRDLITLRDSSDGPHLDSFFRLDERFPDGGDPYSALDLDNEDRGQRHSDGPEILADGVQETDAAPILEEDPLPPLPMDDTMELDLEKQKDVAVSFHELDKINVDSHQTSIHACDEMIGDGRLQNLAGHQLPLQDPKEPPDHLADTVMCIELPAGDPTLVVSRPVCEGEQGIEVPDVEKLRAAIEVAEQETFMMGLDEQFDLGEVPANVNVENAKEMMHRASDVDELRVQVAEDNPFLDQDIPFPSDPSPFITKSLEDTSGGDDMLTSILGGRATPSLRVIETPVETAASLQPKQGLRKRKAIFDDNVVISSFFMKKQLANVDGIRRIRRKVSCKDNDVQREYYFQRTFSGPSIPDLSAELRELYSRVFDREVRLPAAEQPEERALNYDASRHQMGYTSEIPVIGSLLTPSSDARVSTEDFHAVPDTVSFLTHLEDVQGEKISSSGKLKDLIQDHTEPEVPKDPIDQLPKKTKLAAMANGSSVGQLEEINVISDEETTNIQQNAAKQIEKLPPPHGEEMREVVQQFENEVQLCETNLAVREVQEADIPSTHAGEALDTLLTTPEFQQAGASFEPSYSRDFVFISDSKDAEFLAMEEDELLEKDVDPDIPKKRKMAADKIGWSGRTRAVAQYLKNAFEKVETSCKLNTYAAKLNMNGMLTGRTRKEAARMFFEILVLKTKDYVRVEQDNCFGDIYLVATPSLVKGSF